MARKVRPADLTLVPCNCAPDQSLGGGAAATEWHETPKGAAKAVRRAVERGGYWAVHWSGTEGPQHVASAVLDGLQWGPGWPQ